MLFPKCTLSCISRNTWNMLKFQFQLQVLLSTTVDSGLLNAFLHPHQIKFIASNSFDYLKIHSNTFNTSSIFQIPVILLPARIQFSCEKIFGGLFQPESPTQKAATKKQQNPLSFVFQKYHKMVCIFLLLILIIIHSFTLFFYSSKPNNP